MLWDTLGVFSLAKTRIDLPVEPRLLGFVDVVVHDVEAVPAVLAHVGNHITRVWRIVGWESSEQVRLASTLHTNDGVGNRLWLHATLLALPRSSHQMTVPPSVVRPAGTLAVAIDAPRESGSVRAEGATTRESRRHQDRGDEAILESRVRTLTEGESRYGGESLRSSRQTGPTVTRSGSYPP